jgi:hypothetical protein
MKKKAGMQSQSGHLKRNGNIDRRKQRRGPKKRQPTPPLSLQLQVLSRVD